MSWIEEQENRYANHIKREGEIFFEMTSINAVQPMDHTVKYYASTDLFEPKLNWFQKQLQKIGFYKQGVSKIVIFKHNENRTIEQITK